MATWNLKQAVAPKRPLSELWSWLDATVSPDVAVLTEAKVPVDGPPPGWTALWRADGIGHRRRWGTVIAARGVELVDIPGATEAGPLFDERWPATVRVADIVVDGVRWATVVGIYGLTIDRDGASCGSGHYVIPETLESLMPLFESERGTRLILAGDFNLWPSSLPWQQLVRAGLVDLSQHTSGQRSPLDRCSGCIPPCGHLWTHRNGNSPNAARQQIDFIFASQSMLPALVGYRGGVETFADAWAMSDHAPLVAEFALDDPRRTAGRPRRVGRFVDLVRRTRDKMGAERR